MTSCHYFRVLFLTSVTVRNVVWTWVRFSKLTNNLQIIAERHVCGNVLGQVRFEVLTPVKLPLLVFRVVTPSGRAGRSRCQCFGRTRRFRLQGFDGFCYQPNCPNGINPEDQQRPILCSLSRTFLLFPLLCNLKFHYCRHERKHWNIILLLVIHRFCPDVVRVRKPEG